MHISIEQAFTELLAWCRRNDFAGYDPFDALNSRAFQVTPFSRSRTARLLWTQALKRSPINLRSAVLIPKQKNSKGIALFALAALATYRRLKTSQAETEARALLDQLWQMRSNGQSGAAWGYNFPWQSRKFFAPQNTPMIVPTAFAARAFIEAYQAFSDDEYLKAARSACDFIVNDLARTDISSDEVCFSYSPSDKTRIFNASLLAAETLASVGHLTGESELCELATKAARYVIKRQQADGAWAYGADAGQEWVDSFHTAYVLLSLARISKSCSDPDGKIESALQRGFSFWRRSFFLADGWPKYYHDSLYPADAHAAATAIVTLLELQKLDAGARELAGAIAGWTITNLRDTRGFFYYQRRRFGTVRTPFMRWTQAWMLYALARLLET
jgi:Tfp pilus assembly protein PilV